MRTASDALKALLATRNFFIADLYEFTLTDGTNLKYTSWDQDLGGYGHALGWERTQAKWSIGLKVDTMDVTLHATPDQLLSSIPIIESIAAGEWDGAEVTVSRAFMPVSSPGSITGTVLTFTGWVGDITEIGRIHCTMQLRSKTELLNVGMPKGLFQPSCRHVFGSASCGVNRTALAQIGTVGVGSTATVIETGVSQPGPVAAPTAAPSLSSATSSGVNLPANITYYVVVTYVTTIGETTASPESSLLVASSQGLLHVASPPSAANVTGWNVYIGVTPGDEQLQNTTPLTIGASYTEASGGIYLSGIRPPTTSSNGYFSLGTITFTSGANAGLSRSVESTTGSGSATLRVPFFSAVQVGDTFVIVPGCAHTMAACSSQFNNLIHFGGEPFIPVPEVGSA